MGENKKLQFLKQKYVDKYPALFMAMSLCFFN